MDITSEAQLMSVMKDVVSKALNFVLDKCEDELHDCLANVGIPDNGAGHLWEAWEKAKAQMSAKGVEAAFNYNGSSLTLVQTDPWYESEHGSQLSRSMGGKSPNDIRTTFAKVIFEGLAPINPRWGQSGGRQPAKDAWTPFMESVKANLDSWIIAGCASVGIECQRASGNSIYWR